ncbi:MAG: hypothetical protein VB070_12595 [Clostridiaceae bacterium]|nr:hypothetical protein [Clostridiaceae bacterium]
MTSLCCARSLQGIVEDGSQRSYFPTGFPFYVYGETLFDSSVTFEALREDYFFHTFGEKWRDVVIYLENLCDALLFAYLSGLSSSDAVKGKYYNPVIAQQAAGVRELTQAFKPVIEANRNQPKRAAAVSWMLLDQHRDYANGIAEIICHKAVGDDLGAQDAGKQLCEIFSAREIYLERWYDLFLSYYSLGGLCRQE